MSRDQSFLINIHSNDYEKKNFEISVFNPDFKKSSFKEKVQSASERLNNVYMSHRQLGEGEADWKPSLTNLQNGAVQLDFVADYAQEDNNGYTTLDWYHNGIEGAYEIMVETKCNAFANAPEGINSFRQVVLSGVIDLTRPEQYGRPLPLRDTVLLGEEVTVVFTENIDCGRPFQFEITVDVIGTNYEFTNRDLLLVCEGRKISFQIDPTKVLKLDDIVGKSFKVELNSIKDVHGNEIKNGIQFQKSFAHQDLVTSSSSFEFVFENTACDDGTLDLISDKIKDDVASILETDVNRIHINDLSCFEMKDRVVANVSILPVSARNRRELFSSQSERPHELFLKLRNVVETNSSPFKGRKLGERSKISVSKMAIVPSNEDVEKYKSSISNETKEREILDEISLFHHSAQPKNVQESDLQGLEVMMRKLEEMEENQRRQFEEMEENQRRQFEEKKFNTLCMFVLGGLVVYVVMRR